MIRLENSLERHYNWVIRSRVAEEKRDKEEVEIALALVVEHCHPSQLGELPPNPNLLIRKALLLGLITGYSSFVRTRGQ